MAPHILTLLRSLGQTPATVYKLKFVLNRNILTSHKHPVNGSVVFGKQRASDCSYDGDLGSYVSIAGHTDLVSSALPT